MKREHKILLQLSDEEFERLKKIQTSFQTSTVRKVSMSDVLRRALYSLPYQGVLL